MRPQHPKRKEILAKYLNGGSATALARAYGVTKNAILGWAAQERGGPASENGRPAGTPNAAPSGRRADEILSAVLSHPGESQATIARSMKTTPQNVSQLCAAWIDPDG